MNPDSRDPGAPVRPYVRSGQRLNSRSEIVVTWHAGGESVSETARTVNISRTGCMVVVRTEIRLNQRVKVTNTRTGKSAEAFVIWKHGNASAGWECGLGLLVPPEEDFWGSDELY